MINGKFNIGSRLRALISGAAVFVCLIACVLAGGCRSSRNSVEETHREVHTSFKETFNADTVNTAATSSETQTDTATIRTDERAVISLKRDSTGRIIEIYTASSAKIKANYARKTDRDRWFYGLNATRYSETADSVDSVTEKKEETQKEINASIPLESLIGSALLSLVVLYVIYVIIADHLWPWIKNRKR